MKKVCTPWQGIPKDFNPVGLAGFIYAIVHTASQKAYVGRKYFWARTRKKVKGRKRRKLDVKESDWRYYRSSSDDVKQLISKHGLDEFEFHILQVYKTRAEVNYAETREQFLRDVLYSRLPSGEYQYLNHQILGRYYRKRLTSEED